MCLKLFYDKTSQHDEKYGKGSDWRESLMEILIEAKDRGLDLRINIDCCFTMNCPQSTGDQKEPPKEL